MSRQRSCQAPCGDAAVSMRRQTISRTLFGAMLIGAGATAFGVARRNERRLPPLRVVADIALPGPAVRFDYQSVDAGAGRLYIAHMNAGTLLVFDTKDRRVVADLAGFS